MQTPFDFITCRIRSILFLAVVAAMALASGCSRPRSAAPALDFGEFPVVHGIVPEVADQEGFLRDTGLQYRIVSFPTGPDIVAALRPPEKGIDAGVLAIVPVVTMIDAGGDPVIIATILKTDHSVKLVVRQEAHINANPATLRGHTIGVTKSTIGDLYLSRLLSKGNLKETDVRVVPGKPADLVSLLASGDLDAIVTWDPFIADATRALAGKRLVAGVFFDPEIQQFTWHILTTRSKLAAKRNELIMLLKGIVKAGDFLTAHRAEGQKLAEKWLKLEPGDLRQFFRDSDFRVGLDVPNTRDQIVDQLRWLRDGRVTQSVDASVYIDSSLLDQIDSTRVRK